jgi:hypothetical protein
LKCGPNPRECPLAIVQSYFPSLLQTRNQYTELQHAVCVYNR